MWATIQAYLAAIRNPRTKFAARHYLWYRLIFDERGTPAERNKLKARLYERQRGRCSLCRKPFDGIKGAELHRVEAAVGYTELNTSLLHHACHRKQASGSGLPVKPRRK